MATELRRIVEQEGENMTAIIRKALNLYFQFYSLAQEETPGVRTLDVDIRTVGTDGRKGLVSEKIIF